MRTKLIILLQFVLLHTAYGQNWDINLLRQINPDQQNGFVRVNRTISDIATPLAFTLPVVIGADGYLHKDAAMEQKSLTVMGSVLAADAIVTGLKLTVQRPRPFTTYWDIHKYGHGGSYSFPSGHTGESFALATALSLAYPKWYVIVPAYTWASAVGFSRMYLGVHYPTDVLGGMLVGSASSVAAYYLAKVYFQHHRRLLSANLN